MERFARERNLAIFPNPTWVVMSANTDENLKRIGWFKIGALPSRLTAANGPYAGPTAKAQGACASQRAALAAWPPQQAHQEVRPSRRSRERFTICHTIRALLSSSCRQKVGYWSSCLDPTLFIPYCCVPYRGASPKSSSTHFVAYTCTHTVASSKSSSTRPPCPVWHRGFKMMSTLSSGLVYSPRLWLA